MLVDWFNSGQVQSKFCSDKLKEEVKGFFALLGPFLAGNAYRIIYIQGLGLGFRVCNKTRTP